MIPFISTIVFTFLTTYLCFANGQSSCTTPSGNSGICKSLYECSPLLEVVKKSDKTQEDLDTLRKSQCGFDGTTPKVCCPDPCITPDGKPGACVSIYSCQHLAAMLQPPVADENRIYVQNSKCQGTQQYSVCCGPPRAGTVMPVDNCASVVSAFPPDPRTQCCGRDSNAGNRIVGGTATTVDQYPWLALIEYYQKNKVKLLCGGTLISGRYVLTAAHCVVGEVLHLGTPTNVRLSEYDTKHDGPDCLPVEAGGEDCTEGILIIKIERTIPHPNYSTNRKQSPNDIALIRLVKNAPFTDFIRPICLPTTDVTLNPPDNFTMYTSGWGAVSTTEPASNVKLHVDLPFVSKSFCETAYKSSGRNLVVTNGQMCAGGINGKDSCKGDSGGPLMYENVNLIYDLLGVVSFGPTPCGQPNVPGVYTKVYEYIPWIKNTIVS